MKLQQWWQCSIGVKINRCCRVQKKERTSRTHAHTRLTFNTFLIWLVVSSLFQYYTGQFKIHRQKWILHYKTNELKMDRRPKSKMWTFATCKRKHKRKSLCPWVRQTYLRSWKHSFIKEILINCTSLKVKCPWKTLFLSICWVHMSYVYAKHVSIKSTFKYVLFTREIPG
jgi:hypothetical protein